MVLPVNTHIQNYDPENYLQRDIGRGVKVLVDQNTNAQIAYSEVRPWNKRSCRLYILAPVAGLGALVLGIFAGRSLSAGSGSKSGGACLVGATGLLVSSVYLSNRKYPIDQAARIMTKRVKVLGQERSEKAEVAIHGKQKISSFFTPKERFNWIAKIKKVEDFGTDAFSDLAGAVKDAAISDGEYERLNSLYESYRGLLAKETIESTEFGKLRVALEEFKNECGIQVAMAEKEYNESSLVHEANQILEDKQAEVLKMVNAIKEEAVAKQASIESESKQSLEKLRTSSRGDLLEVMSLEAYYDCKDESCRMIEEVLTEMDARTKAIINEYNESVQPLVQKVKALEEKHDSIVVEVQREWSLRLEAFNERSVLREQKMLTQKAQVEELNQSLTAELPVSDSVVKPFVPQNFTLHSSITHPELRDWATSEMIRYANEEVIEEVD